MNAQRLTIDLRGYWHPGGGRGGGAVLDAVTHRDSSGLPVLGGRHIKGLLRDALESAAAFGWDGYAGLAQQLFGERFVARSRMDQNDVVEAGDDISEQRSVSAGVASEAPGCGPAPGLLRVTDATLPETVQAWLADNSRRKRLVPHLYRALYATAVDPTTGTAKDKSLRGIEVVVPLQLAATVEPMPGPTLPPTDWPERLRAVLPLIDAVGALRNRGLGRAVFSLEDV